MSVKVIIHQIEIGFWDVFISIMHKSSFLRFIVPKVYRILHTKEFYTSIVLIFSLAFLGLSLGLIFGVISQI